MTPEGKIKEGVKKVLKKHGAYYHMPVMNGMGAPTLDFIGCHNGWFFAIETKAPGGKPTQRQQHTIEAMKAAGGAVFVVSCEEEIRALDAELDWFADMRYSAHRELHRAP